VQLLFVKTASEGMDAFIINSLLVHSQAGDGLAITHCGNLKYTAFQKLEWGLGVYLGCTPWFIRKKIYSNTTYRWYVVLTVHS